MKARELLTVVVSISVIGWMPAMVFAFDVSTHRDLNEFSADVSKLEGYLKSQLGLENGLTERILGNVVREWIRRGGAAEDAFLRNHTIGAFVRSRHHFHDPLAAGWNQAGLNAASPCPPFLLRGESSARWAQDPDQGMSARAAWSDARTRFLEGLMLASKGERDRAMAQMFQIIGQQMHLIVDLAVPAHTRNDPHCPSPEGFERWAEEQPAIIATLAGGKVVRPDASIFGAGLPIDDPVATVPVARLWDTDQYDGTNPGVTAESSTIGLAEYTNANFFSDDTVFQRYPFPASGSMELGPPEVEAKTGELRRYFRKVRDGERIDHAAVPSALYDSLPEALRDRRKGFDDTVFRDYAAKLIPRAVGYSAALLDYFFRGRLDVDVFPEADDPSIVRVKGANASTDALVDGTLTLYGDDPNGVRRAAAAQGDVTVADVPVAGEVVSARFHLPEDTERVVAVYQGTLGNELKSPDGSSPGGVIGKVLGGVRVEQIFADGGAWKVRTPKGIFTLPLSTGEFEEVKWGDGDDIIVARTPFGDFEANGSARNRFVSYRVARRPGSADFTVTGASPLELTRLSDVVFPLGMAVGTTVHFSQSIHYRQQIARVGLITSTFTWNGGTYVPTDVEIDSPEPVFETAHSQTLSFSEQFPIVLDTFHNSNFLDPGATDNRYIWFLDSVTADTSGRLLALIGVHLIRPNGGSVVPFFIVDPDTGARVEQGQVFVPGFFPAGINPLLWAVVDLQARQVVASSAPGDVVISSDTAAEAPPWASPSFAFALGGGAFGLYAPSVRVFVGGNAPGTAPLTWIPLSLGTLDRSRTTPIFTAEASSTVGQQRVEVGGWPRSELAAVLPASYRVVNTQTRTEKEYLRKSDTEAYAMTLVTSQGRFADHPPRLMEARRTRPTAGTERLVFLAERRGNDDLGVGHVVVWEPLLGQARVAADLPTESYRLRSASSGAALVTTSLNLTPTSRFVPLDGVAPPSMFEGDLSETFTVLDPMYLYNVGDFRFYRPAPLRPTALPARLAPANALGGDFHDIRVP